MSWADEGRRLLACGVTYQAAARFLNIPYSKLYRELNRPRKNLKPDPPWLKPAIAMAEAGVTARDVAKALGVNEHSIRSAFRRRSISTKENWDQAQEAKHDPCCPERMAKQDQAAREAMRAAGIWYPSDKERSKFDLKSGSAL